MRLKWFHQLVFIAIVLSAACTPPAAAQPASPSLEITVLAAASLTEPFKQIGADFEAANPNVKVTFSFGGSQALAQQLENGAPADVFASANTKYMDAAVASGRVAQDSPQIFANNRLVVIIPKDNPGGIQTLQDLAKAGVKLDFADKAVPVGGYSQTFLEKASADPAFSPTFKEDVLKNVVSFEDNVKTVLAKVALGEADAGIVYTSDISADAADKVSKIEIPDALNVIAVYPIAPLKDSPHARLAKAFSGWVLSDAGQKVLNQYGFLSPAK